MSKQQTSSESREIVAEIISFVTGIPKERLEEFKLLKRLLKAAERLKGRKTTVTFGLWVFTWRYEGQPKLVIWNDWGPAVGVVEHIESLMWPHHARPFGSLAQFWFDERTMQSFKERGIEFIRSYS